MNVTASTLISYMPALLHQRCCRDAQAMDAPWRESLSAAVFFIDISGFTALAERLGGEGPAGTERLTACLNGVFGELIGLVAARGGDVVKFAGDALLALWPVTDELTLVAATHLAADCGLACQAALAARAPGAEFQLSLRVAVGAGELTCAQIGGEGGRWELLFGGAPLSDVAAAESLALPGEVVLTPAARTVLGARCEADERTSVAWRVVSLAPNGPAAAALTGQPSATAFDLDRALAAYLPAAIVGKMQAGQSAWLAEMRQITVLFVKLPKWADESNAGGLGRLQVAMVAMQKALGRFEGTINKLAVDEKGVSLVAVMGLPPVYHEDDAVRGVMAALTVRARLRELGVRAAIGVATGTAFCGEIGNEHRREYTVIGQVVNLAARLMQNADSILCDGPTMRAARLRLDFEALPAIAVKGVTALVPVFRPHVQARRHGPVDQEPLGRAAELASLDAALRDLKRGRGGSLLIEGEAGMGKSLLLKELGARASERGVMTLLGEADAMEASLAYHPWRGVFEAIAAVVGIPGDREAVLNWLAISPDLAPLAALLNVVWPLDFPDSPLTGGLEGQARADATRDMLVRVIGLVAARGPLLVVIEDAQWMDSASWALAALVEQQLPNVLIAVGLRTGEPLFDEAAGFMAAPRLCWLRLEPLAEEAAIALVCRRLGVATVPAAVRDLITERAAGHPFFSEELATALRDAGVLAIADGTCELKVDAGQLAALELPQTIQGVITRRIDRLSPAEQLTLKVASVIGRNFDYRLLHDVYPIERDRPRLADVLTALDLHDFTQADGPSPEHGYMFRQLLTRDVVYDLMLFAQRRALHREVADWYETVYEGDLAPLSPRLAHHWREAADPARALPYMLRAAEQALATFANREALRFAGQASKVAAALAPAEWPDRFDKRLLWVDMEASAALGALDHALECADSLVALDPAWLPVGKGSSEPAPAGVLATRASLLIRQGRFTAAIAAIDQALPSIGRVVMEPGPLGGLDERTVGWLMAHRIDCHYRQGEFRQALEQAEAVLTRTPPDETRLRGFLLGMFGLASGSLGDVAGAREAFERQLAVDRAAGDLYGMAHAHNNLGRTCQQLAALDEAWEHYSRGLEVASRIGDLRLQSMLTNNLGGILLAQGKLEPAREHFERALASHRHMHNRNGEAIALCNLGELCQAMGDLTAAQSYTMEGIEALIGIGANGLLGEALCLLARIKLDLGLPRRALELAERAHVLGQDTGQPVLCSAANLLLDEAREAARGESDSH